MFDYAELTEDDYYNMQVQEDAQKEQDLLMCKEQQQTDRYNEDRDARYEMMQEAEYSAVEFTDFH